MVKPRLFRNGDCFLSYMDLNKTSGNRLIYVPVGSVRALGNHVVVSPTDHYTKYITDSGLSLPVDGDTYAEKKFDIGEVISVGDDITGLSVGDIVVWQCTSSWRLPNGIDKPTLFAMGRSAITCVLPKPESDSEWHESKSGRDQVIPRKAEQSPLCEEELRAAERVIVDAYRTETPED